jgi:hypothetical protein
MVQAHSSYEFVIGYHSVPYVPLASRLPVNIADRLFVIANGTESVPNNALTILKNGNAGLSGVPVPTHPLEAASGAHLTAGGVWANASDRALKENLEPVDHESLLEKLRELPLYKWNYKAEGASVSHVGPMAQDFRAAFKLGENERSIGTVDADGVALSAIQALLKKMDQLTTENVQLRERLEKLEEKTPREP